VIGDIHSNYDALSAVVQSLQREKVDRVLCVGDIVGYAAEPAPCIDLVHDLNCVFVAGNHDYAAVGKFPADYFHHDARAAIMWTIKNLTQGYLDFLRNMPLIEELDDITIVHGSLNRPEFFDYIRTGADAQMSFDLLKTSMCFFGHTHIPMGIYLENGTVHVDRGTVYYLKNAEKALINVGSVGQSRDWDARACFAIYDSEEKVVQIKRVKYDINSAAEKIYQAGLPASNALRLIG
jgi:diadenosine tetraphosphatase ApaH/serine/threonine PP2A family protein phosphatase